MFKRTIKASRDSVDYECNNNESSKPKMLTNIMNSLTTDQIAKAQTNENETNNVFFHSKFFVEKS